MGLGSRRVPRTAGTDQRCDNQLKPASYVQLTSATLLEISQLTNATGTCADNAMSESSFASSKATLCCGAADPRTPPKPIPRKPAEARRPAPSRHAPRPRQSFCPSSGSPVLRAPRLPREVSEPVRRGRVGDGRRRRGRDHRRGGWRRSAQVGRDQATRCQARPRPPRPGAGPP